MPEMNCSALVRGGITVPSSHNADYVILKTFHRADLRDVGCCILLLRWPCRVLAAVRYFLMDSMTNEILGGDVVQRCQIFPCGTS